jgi:hypothetical protein
MTESVVVVWAGRLVALIMVVFNGRSREMRARCGPRLPVALATILSGP